MEISQRFSTLPMWLPNSMPRRKSTKKPPTARPTFRLCWCQPHSTDGSSRVLIPSTTTSLMVWCPSALMLPGSPHGSLAAPRAADIGPSFSHGAREPTGNPPGAPDAPRPPMRHRGARMWTMAG